MPYKPDKEMETRKPESITIPKDSFGRKISVYCPGCEKNHDIIYIPGTQVLHEPYSLQETGDYGRYNKRFIAVISEDGKIDVQGKS